jgi:hypothetical protein
VSRGARRARADGAAQRPASLKAKDPIADRDLRGLRALREEELLKHYVLVSLEARPRVVDGIRILPWQEFLERLWSGGWD